jgi:hypothetical protein
VLEESYTSGIKIMNWIEEEQNERKKFRTPH